MRVFSIMATIFIVFTHKAVWAFKAGDTFTSANVGFDLYKLVVTNGLDGPIGWVVVAILLVLGLVQMAKGQAMPALMAIGSGVLIKAVPSIMTSLGMTFEQAQMLATAGTLIW